MFYLEECDLQTGFVTGVSAFTKRQDAQTELARRNAPGVNRAYRIVRAPKPKAPTFNDEFGAWEDEYPSG